MSNNDFDTIISRLNPQAQQLYAQVRHDTRHRQAVALQQAKQRHEQQQRPIQLSGIAGNPSQITQLDANHSPTVVEISLGTRHPIQQVIANGILRAGDTGVTLAATLTSGAEYAGNHLWGQGNVGFDDVLTKNIKNFREATGISQEWQRSQQNKALSTLVAEDALMQAEQSGTSEWDKMLNALSVYAHNPAYTARKALEVGVQSGLEMATFGGLGKGAAMLSQGVSSGVGYLHEDAENKGGRYTLDGLTGAAIAGAGTLAFNKASGVLTKGGSFDDVVANLVTSEVKNTSKQGAARYVGALGVEPVTEALDEAFSQGVHNFFEGKAWHHRLGSAAASGAAIGVASQGIVSVPAMASGMMTLGQNNIKDHLSNPTNRLMKQTDAQINQALAKQGNDTLSTQERLDARHQLNNTLGQLYTQKDDLVHQYRASKNTKEQARLAKQLDALDNFIMGTTQKINAYQATYNSDDMAQKFIAEKIQEQNKLRYELYKAGGISLPAQNFITNGTSLVNTNTTSSTKPNTSSQQQISKTAVSNHQGLVAIMGDYRQGDTGRGSGDHYDLRVAKDSKYGRTDINQYLDRFVVEGKPLNTYKQTGRYGEKRSTGAHWGVDYGINGSFGGRSQARYLHIAPEWLDKVAKVTSFNNGKDKGGFVTKVTFTDGIKVNILHQNQDKVQQVVAGWQTGRQTQNNANTHARTVTMGQAKARYGSLSEAQSSMLNKVAAALDKHDVSVEFKKVMLGQVGREGGYNFHNLVSPHSDAANGSKNIGIISFQGSRQSALLNFLAQKGLYKQGKIVGDQDALIQANVDFMIHEITTNKAYAQTKALLHSNDKDKLWNTTSRNYIRWAIDKPEFKDSGTKNFETFYKFASEYYAQPTTSVTSDANGSDSLIQDTAQSVSPTMTDTDSVLAKLQAQLDGEENAQKQAELQAQIDELQARQQTLQEQTASTPQVEKEVDDMMQAKTFQEALRYSVQFDNQYINQMVQSKLLNEQQAHQLRTLYEVVQQANQAIEQGVVSQQVYYGNKTSNILTSNRGLQEYQQRLVHGMTALSGNEEQDAPIHAGLTSLYEDLVAWQASHNQKAKAVMTTLDQAKQTGRTYAVVRKEDSPEWVIQEGSPYTKEQLKELGGVSIHRGSGGLVQQINQEAKHINQMAGLYELMLKDSPIPVSSRLANPDKYGASLMEFGESPITSQPKTTAITRNAPVSLEAVPETADFVVARASRQEQQDNAADHAAYHQSSPTVARPTSQATSNQLGEGGLAHTPISTPTAGEAVNRVSTTPVDVGTARNQVKVNDNVKQDYPTVVEFHKNHQTDSNAIWLGRAGNSKSISRYLFGSYDKNTNTNTNPLVETVQDEQGNTVNRLKAGVLGFATNLYPQSANKLRQGEVDAYKVIYQDTGSANEQRLAKQVAQIEQANRFVDMLKVGVKFQHNFALELNKLAHNPDLVLYGNKHTAGQFSEATIINAVLPKIRQATHGTQSKRVIKERVASVLDNLGTLMNDGQFHQEVPRQFDVNGLKSPKDLGYAYHAYTAQDMARFTPSVQVATKPTSDEVTLLDNQDAMQTTQDKAVSQGAVGSTVDSAVDNEASGTQVPEDNSVFLAMLKDTKPDTKPTTDTTPAPTTQTKTDTQVVQAQSALLDTPAQTVTETDLTNEGSQDGYPQPVSTRLSGITPNKANNAKTKQPAKQGMYLTKQDKPSDVVGTSLEAFVDKAVPVSKLMQTLSDTQTPTAVPEAVQDTTQPPRPTKSKADHRHAVIETLLRYNPDVKIQLQSKNDPTPLGVSADGLVRVSQDSNDLVYEVAQGVARSTLGKVADELDGLTQEMVREAIELGKSFKEELDDTELDADKPKMSDQERETLARTNKLVGLKKELDFIARQVSRQLRHLKTTLDDKTVDKVYRAIRQSSNLLFDGVLDTDVKGVLEQVVIPSKTASKTDNPDKPKSAYRTLVDTIAKFLGFNQQEQNAYQVLLSSMAKATSIAVHDDMSQFGYSKEAKLAVFDEALRSLDSPVGASKDMTNPRHILATHFVQKQSKHKPLSSIKDFVHQLGLKPIKATQTLQLDAPSEAQLNQIKDFVEFHQEFSTHLKDTVISKDDGFKHESLASYFVNELGEVNDNVLGALSYVAYDFIIANANHTKHTDDDIKELLGLYDEAQKEAVYLNQSLRQTYQHIGFVHGLMAEKLGGQVAKSLGIQSSDDGSQTLDSRLNSALGGWVLASLQAADLIHINELPTQTHLDNINDINPEHAKNISASQHGKTRFVSFTDTNGEKQNEWTTHIVQTNKGTAGYLAKVMGGQSLLRQPLLTAPDPDKVKLTIKRTLAQVSDEQAKLVAKAQLEPMVINEDFDGVIHALYEQHEQALLQMIGAEIPQQTFDTAHANERAGMLGKAAGIKRDLDNALDFITSITPNGQGVRQFWDTMFMAVNSRMHLNSNVFNIQSSKLHRAWADLQSYQTTIKTGGGSLTKLLKKLNKDTKASNLTDNQLKLTYFIRALGENMEGSEDFIQQYLYQDPQVKALFRRGFTVDKLPSYLFVPAFMAYLSQDHLVQATKAMIALLDKQSISQAQMTYIAEAVKEMGMGANSLRALMEWARFTQANDKGSQFSTRLGLGSDGLNNGAFLAHTSAGSGYGKLYDRTGLYLTTSEFANYFDARHDPDLGDYYTGFSDLVAQRLQERIDRIGANIERAYAKFSNLSEHQLTKLRTNERLHQQMTHIKAINPTLTARNVSKGVLVPFNYGAGMGVVGRSLFGVFTSDVQKRLVKLALDSQKHQDNPDALNQLRESTLMPLITALQAMTQQEQITLYQVDNPSQSITLDGTVDMTTLNEYWFDKKTLDSLASSFEEAVGGWVISTLQMYERDYIQATRRNMAMLTAGAILYLAVYEQAYAQAIEHKYQTIKQRYLEQGMTLGQAEKYAKREVDYVGLNNQEVNQLLDRLKPVLPTVATPHSVVGQEDKAKLHLVKQSHELSKSDDELTRNNFYLYNQQGLLQSAVTSSPVRRLSVEEVAMLVNSAQTQQQDSRISSLAMAGTDTVFSNVHDANIAGVGHQKQMIVAQNKAAYHTLATYHTQLSSLTMLHDVIKGTQKLVADKVVDLDLTNGSTFSDALFTAIMYLPAVKQAELTKLNALMQTKTLHQYAGEFGEYHINKADKQIVQESINAVGTYSQAILNDLTQIQQELGLEPIKMPDRAVSLEQVQVTTIINPDATNNLLIEQVWQQFPSQLGVNVVEQINPAKLTKQKQAQARVWLNTHLHNFQKLIKDSTPQKPASNYTKYVASYLALKDADALYLVDGLGVNAVGNLDVPIKYRHHQQIAQKLGIPVLVSMEGRWYVQHRIRHNWQSIHAPISKQPAVIFEGEDIDALDALIYSVPVQTDEIVAEQTQEVVTVADVDKKKLTPATYTLDKLRQSLDKLVDSSDVQKSLNGYLMDAAKVHFPKLKIQMAQITTPSGQVANGQFVKDTITLNQAVFTDPAVSDNEKMRIVNHELIHALTEHNIMSGNPRFAKALNDLEAMRQQLNQKWQSMVGQNPHLDARMQLIMQIDEVSEFVAYGMTDYHVAKFIEQHLDTKALGLKTSSPKLDNAFKWFIAAVSSALGLGMGNFSVFAQTVVQLVGDKTTAPMHTRYSASVMKSIKANIARGTKAMNKAITEKTTVHRAMYRNDIGWIDFEWGDTGTLKANGKTKGAMGISHIIEARMRKDGMSYDEAVKFLTSDIVNSIAMGIPSTNQVRNNTQRLGVVYENTAVYLVKTAGSNAWVITGFELFTDKESQTMNQSRGATTSDLRTSSPTLSRTTVGASDETSVPSTDAQSNQKIRYSVRHTVEQELDRPLNEVFDSLIDERIDEAHASHLSEVINAIYTPEYHSVLMGSDELSELYQQVPYPAAPTGLFDLSAKESVAYRAIYAALEHLLNHHNDNQASLEMHEVYGQLLAHFDDVKVLYPDYDTMSQAAQELADKRHQNLFGSTSTNKHRVAHLMALMLSSQALKDKLSIRLDKKAAKTTNKAGWFDKLMNLAYQAFSLIRGKFILKANTSNEAVLELAMKLAKIDGQARLGQASKLDALWHWAYTKPTNLADKATNLLVGKGYEALQKVHEKVSPHQDSDGSIKSSTARAISAMMAMADIAKKLRSQKEAGNHLSESDATKQGLEQVLDNATSILHDKLGKYGQELGDILTEMRGIHDDLSRSVEQMQRYNTKADNLRNGIKDATLGVVNGWFDESLDDTQKDSMTRGLLLTDAQALLNHHEEAQVVALLMDKAKRHERLNALTQKLIRLVPTKHIHNDMLIQSKVLAHYMAFEEVKEGLIKSSEMIAASTGTSWGIEYEAINPDVLAIIDEITTLHALNYAKPKYLNQVAKLLDTHQQGVLNVLRLQKALVEQSKQEFADNPFNYNKGYTASVLDPYVDVKAVTADEVPQYQAQGYELVSDKPLEQDPADHTPQRYLMRNGEYPAIRRVSGAVNLQDTHHMGTKVVDWRTDGAELARIGREQLKRREKRAKSISYQDFDPKESSGKHLVAVAGVDNMITHYQYEMAGDVKDALLNREMSFDMLLATQLASLQVNPYVKALQKQMAQALVSYAKDDRQGFKRNPKNFIVLTPNSHDAKIKELYNMMPYEFRQALQAGFGRGKPMVLPKKEMTMLFGFGKYSVGELFDKLTDERNLFEKLIYGIFTRIYHDKAKNKAVAYQQAWESMVTWSKQNIVIRGGDVLMGNIAANLLMLILNGVTPSQIIKDVAYGWREGKRYMDWQQESLQLQTKRLAARDSDDLAKIDKRLDQLDFQMKSSGMHRYMQEGLMSSIVEDVDTTTQTKLFKPLYVRQWEDKAGKLPQPVRTVAKWVFLHPDTPAFQMLAQATQFSDLVAKYSLARHLEKEALKQGVSRQAAFQQGIVEAQKTFLNYDTPTSRGTQALNDNGMLLFSKFSFRFQRVLLKHLMDKTGHVLAQHWLAENVLDTAGILNPLLPIPNTSTGVGTLVSGLVEQPAYKLLF